VLTGVVVKLLVLIPSQSLRLTMIDPSELQFARWYSDDADALTNIEEREYLDGLVRQRWLASPLRQQLIEVSKS